MKWEIRRSMVLSTQESSPYYVHHHHHLQTTDVWLPAWILWRLPVLGIVLVSRPGQQLGGCRVVLAVVSTTGEVAVVVAQHTCEHPLHEKQAVLRSDVQRRVVEILYVRAYLSFPI